MSHVRFSLAKKIIILGRIVPDFIRLDLARMEKVTKVASVAEGIDEMDRWNRRGGLRELIDGMGNGHAG